MAQDVYESPLFTTNKSLSGKLADRFGCRRIRDVLGTRLQTEPRCPGVLPDLRAFRWTSEGRISANSDVLVCRNPRSKMGPSQSVGIGAAGQTVKADRPASWTA